MKLLKLHLFLTFTLFLTIAGYSQCDYEMTSKSLSDIKFESECVKEFITSYESHLSLEILDSKVFENNSGTFLLSKVKIDHKKIWIYIISVSLVNNSVIISDNGTLNACESEELSLEVFTFKEGKIIGCKKDNHSISKKQ